MSRPTKLTIERQNKICALISIGNFAKVAAAACNIGETTFYRWLAKGREAKSGRYFDFFQAVQIAEAQAQVRYVKIIYDASETTWQAAAWWLERRFPDRWGRKQRHEISGGDKPIEVEATITIEQIKSIEAERRRLVDETLRGDAGMDSPEATEVPARGRRGGGGVAGGAGHLDVNNFIHHYN